MSCATRDAPIRLLLCAQPRMYTYTLLIRPIKGGPLSWSPAKPAALSTLTASRARAARSQHKSSCRGHRATTRSKRGSGKSRPPYDLTSTAATERWGESEFHCGETQSLSSIGGLPPSYPNSRALRPHAQRERGSPRAPATVTARPRKFRRCAVVPRDEAGHSLGPATLGKARQTQCRTVPHVGHLLLGPLAVLRHGCAHYGTSGRSGRRQRLPPS